MTATVIRPARTSVLARWRHERPDSGPVPGHVDDAERGRHLDGGGQRAEHDAPDRAFGARRGDAGEEEPHHDGVVVGTPDEGEQGQRVEHGEDEGGRGVAAERAGELGDAVGDERDARHRLQSEQHDRDQRVVEAERGRPPRQHQEERTVRGGGVEPQAVDGVGVGTRPERSRPVVVRVDVVAHHLALGGVGEDVAAEQRRHGEERQEPENQHPGQRPHRHARTGPQGLEETEPHPDEEDHAAVDGDHTGEHERRGGPVAHAEEPGASHLELEGRARQGGAEADGEDGDETEQRGPAQERPVVRLARLGLDLAGQPGPRASGGGGRRRPTARAGRPAPPPGRGGVLEAASRWRPLSCQSRLRFPGATKPDGGGWKRVSQPSRAWCRNRSETPL